MRLHTLTISCLVLIVQHLVISCPGNAAPARTRLVSGDAGGVCGDEASQSPTISGDGRYVAFLSNSSNLGFERGFTSVYLYDRRTRLLKHAVKPLGGVESDDSSTSPVISRNGKFLAFNSYVNNLVEGDVADGEVDAYIYKRVAGTYEKISVTSSEETVAGDSFVQTLSSNGRYVLFSSDSADFDVRHQNNKRVLFMRDRKLGTTSYLNVATDSADPNESIFTSEQGISDNGRFVIFETTATNILPNSVNTGYSVYVHDRRNSTTRRISMDHSGAEGVGNSYGGRITADGRRVYFTSTVALTADDQNGQTDIFMRDLRRNRITRLLTGPGGTQLSAHVALNSISYDGRFIVFRSSAAELPGTQNGALSQIFIFDRRTKRVSLVSANSAGQGGNTWAYYDAAVSDNGRFVAFDSAADNLGGTDTNGLVDVFLRIRGTGR